jgi:hypothetical protein
MAIARSVSERDAFSTWTVVSGITAAIACTIAGARGVLVTGVHPTVFLAVLALAVVPQCLGQGLVVVLAKDAEPLLGVVAIVGETVTTSLLALVMFHEPLAPVMISIASFAVGLVLIMGSPGATAGAALAPERLSPQESARVTHDGDGQGIAA